MGAVGMDVEAVLRVLGAAGGLVASTLMMGVLVSDAADPVAAPPVIVFVGVAATPLAVLSILALAPTERPDALCTPLWEPMEEEG